VKVEHVETLARSFQLADALARQPAGVPFGAIAHQIEIGDPAPAVAPQTGADDAPDRALGRRHGVAQHDLRGAHVVLLVRERMLDEARERLQAEDAGVDEQRVCRRTDHAARSSRANNRCGQTPRSSAP
jgi:hypothetical protein